MASPDKWLDVLQTFGLAVVILFFLAFSAWKTAGWTAREIVVPFRDVFLKRVVAFFDGLDNSIAELKDLIHAQNALVEEVTKRADDPGHK